MGPFLAAGSSKTTEWCDSGIEGKRRRRSRVVGCMCGGGEGRGGGGVSK